MLDCLTLWTIQLKSTTACSLAALQRTRMHAVCSDTLHWFMRDKQQSVHSAWEFSPRRYWPVGCMLSDSIITRRLWMEILYLFVVAALHCPHSLFFPVLLYITNFKLQVPSVLWHCWLVGRKGVRPVKTEWWGTGMVICLERGADLHMAQLMPLPFTVSCFSKIQIGFNFLVLAHLGSPGQRPLNGRCVCVCD